VIVRTDGTLMWYANKQIGQGLRSRVRGMIIGNDAKPIVG